MSEDESDNNKREKFGDSIRDLRIQKNLTQTELAIRSGTTEATLSKMENGRGNPKFDTLIRIAVVLDAEITLEPNELPSNNNESKLNHMMRKLKQLNPEIQDKVIPLIQQMIETMEDLQK